MSVISFGHEYRPHSTHGDFDSGRKRPCQIAGVSAELSAKHGATSIEVMGEVTECHRL